jgi:threonine/homoserine/homoserine lactone efflux protein
MLTFFSGLYIGLINNVPTGPVSVYLISLYEKKSINPLIAVVFAAIFSDWLHLLMILLAPDILSVDSLSANIGIGLSILLIVYGIIMIIRALNKNLEKETIPVKDNITIIFLEAFFLNAVNPFAIISMIALLNSAYLLPIPEKSIIQLFIGYTISAVILWSTYAYVIHTCKNKLHQYKRIILLFCGSIVTLSGLSYLYNILFLQSDYLSLLYYRMLY